MRHSSACHRMPHATSFSCELSPYYGRIQFRHLHTHNSAGFNSFSKALKLKTFVSLDHHQVPYGVYEWESIGEAASRVQSRGNAELEYLKEYPLLSLCCCAAQQRWQKYCALLHCRTIYSAVKLEALACAMLDLHGVTTLSRSSAQALDVLGEAGFAEEPDRGRSSVRFQCQGGSSLGSPRSQSNSRQPTGCEPATGSKQSAS